MSTTLDERRRATGAPTRPSPSVPDRTLVQRLEALERANEVRTAKAQIKRDLKAGRRNIGSLLLEPPDVCATAKVFELLLAVPKVGRVKASKTLLRVGVSPSKTVGGLTARQRSELVVELNPRRPRR